MESKFVPPPYKRLKNFASLRRYIFRRFRRITFKLGKFTEFKALFSAVSADIRYLALNNTSKNRKRVSPELSIQPPPKLTTSWSFSLASREFISSAVLVYVVVFLFRLIDKSVRELATINKALTCT